jgi:DNA-binding SARP family transcriptional activator/Tfp pilus assembly protein PilF
VRIRILGTLEVLTEDQWQPIGSPKWRSLLACLLVRSGQVVSTDSLMDELWGDDPPETAKNLISIYVLRLRRLLGDADGKLLAYRSPGYVLNLADGDLDAHRFESLVADGRSALMSGDAARAATLLAAGLGLYRGSYLADVPPSPLVSAAAGHAMELRLSATELWAEADLACGRPAEVVPELRRLVAENQLREGLWLLLMRALDAAGRHAEALEAYGQAREAIAGELGVDPGAELQRLYAEILAADTATGAGREPAVPHDDGYPDAEGPEAAGDVPEEDLTGRISIGSFVAPEVLPAASGTAGPAPAAPAPSVSASDPAMPRPAQLPADIGDFTGREEHVRHLCDMLTQGYSARGHSVGGHSVGAAGSPGAVPIAFVAGAGGLGKTTLAIHAAHQLRDQFPDGQLYVDLLGATPQPLAPGDVLARFLRDLGVEGSKVPTGDEERAALYRTRLTGRRVLVVLDNARDNAQVRPLLPGSAACAVLVTTRNRTADLASTRYVDLHVLDDDEALALFTRILDDGRTAAEPDATAEVLVACAGLPLAIRICGARLTARRQWQIATMARRLRDERRRLDELKLGDLAVRASFQVSYDSLPRGAGIGPARAFRLLGLWQGSSISLPAAAALVGVPDEGAVADALESLVDAHLLESPEADWYRFHDLLRFYATERAQAEETEAERAAAVERVLRWYLRTADGVADVVSPNRYRIPVPDDAPDGPRWQATTVEDALDWYDSERLNVLAAVRQAAQSGLRDVAWGLPTALFPAFNRRANWADCITSHRIALAAARAAGNRPAEGWAANNLGGALHRVGDKEAFGHLEQALAIRRELGDSIGEAQSALNTADAYLALEGPEVALAPFQRSVDVLRGAGNKSMLVVALNNLGEVYADLGRLAEAEECLLDARSVSAGTAGYGEAHAVRNLGRVYLEQGRRDDAIAALRESLILHREAGDVHSQAIALSDLGRAYQEAEDQAAARESWTRALAIYRQIGRVAEAATIEVSLAAMAGRRKLSARPPHRLKPGYQYRYNPYCTLNSPSTSR